jgi:RNA polymerase sigma factor (TIGR02999 family)
MAGVPALSPQRRETYLLTAPACHELTELLRSWTGGDQSALPKIIELVYPELRNIARRCLNRERDDHSMQATSLVHEMYIRLVDIHRVQWQDRAHFFAVGARLMRRILVDHARARAYAKRGGGRARVNFDDSLMVVREMNPSILQVDKALNRLAEFDERKARVVEMRYFGGLTADEIASVLAVSPQSVHRDWSLAKAWLAREMRSQKNYVKIPRERNERRTLGVD